MIRSLEEQNKLLRMILEKDTVTNNMRASFAGTFTLTNKKLDANKKETLRHLDTIIKLKEQLSNAKLKIVELKCNIEIKNELYDKANLELTTYESELLSTRKSLKEYENEFGSVEAVRNAIEGLKNQVKELKQQKVENTKQLIKMKALVLAMEQKNTEANPSKPHLILEEMKNSISETLAAYKAINVIIKEMKAFYQQKLNQTKDVEQILNNYINTQHKQERLKAAKDLETYFVILKAIPKRIMNLQIIDCCVEELLKAKRKKVKEYTTYIEKYENLIKTFNNKCKERIHLLQLNS